MSGWTASLCRTWGRFDGDWRGLAKDLAQPPWLHWFEPRVTAPKPGSGPAGPATALAPGLPEASVDAEEIRLFFDRGGLVVLRAEPAGWRWMRGALCAPEDTDVPAGLGGAQGGDRLTVSVDTQPVVWRRDLQRFFGDGHPYTGLDRIAATRLSCRVGDRTVAWWLQPSTPEGGARA